MVRYDELYWFAVANRMYRKGYEGFHQDRREIAAGTAVGIIDAWKERCAANKNLGWFSAPFDGVWDFYLLEEGKTR